MKTYTLDELTQIALKYDTRADWSTNDPESYDYALNALVQGQDESQFLAITDHMAFNEGRTLMGDPNDLRLLYLRRQLSLAEKRLASYPCGPLTLKEDDKRQDLEIKCSKIHRQIRRRNPC